MGSDSWWMAIDGDAAPGWATMNRDDDVDAYDGTMWDVLCGHDHDHDRDAHVVYRYSAIADDYAYNVVPGWFPARVDGTSALAPRYKFLCSVDSHNQYVYVYAHIVGSLQNVNVFSNGYEIGDASCFVACRIGRIGSLGPRIEPTKHKNAKEHRQRAMYDSVV